MHAALTHINTRTGTNTHVYTHVHHTQKLMKELTIDNFQIEF